MRYRVLWIEDNALSDLAPLLGPIYVSGQYDLEIAESASDGAYKIQSMEFEAVIIDIRLPPGDDPRWVSNYNRLGRDRARARLGLSLLYSFLRPGDAWVKVEHPPAWVQPNRFGVFSKETKAELVADLNRLRVSVYKHKSADNSTRVLLDVIETITKNR